MRTKWVENFGYNVFGISFSRGLHNSSLDWVLTFDLGKTSWNIYFHRHEGL